MKKKYLYNQKNKEDLLDIIKKENFSRITISFYKYIKLKNLKFLRDELYLSWKKLNILGRVYIANEGINAQINIPKNNFSKFKNLLNKDAHFNKIPIKIAIEEGISFYKLSIKIKKEIVAYKIPENEYDLNKTGKHLNYREYNKAINDGAIVIDVRNHYESEVGKFETAITPDVDRSEDLLPEIKNMLNGKKNNKILLYCTGGIRCEKASSYLIHHGFKDVNQLKGGIIQYSHDVKKNNDENKFKGKNYVFDNRLGERITDDILSFCHQCKSPSDEHINCINQACHILFIQCKKCNKKYNSCCSKECKDFIKFPKLKQKELFKSGKFIFNAQKSKSVKPKLYEINKN